MFSHYYSVVLDQKDAFPLLTQYLGYLTLFSILTFLLSIAIIPLIVRRLSVHYFINLTKPENTRTKPSTFSFIFILLRNLLGLVLLIAGIAMLFLPGQGLLTILLAILLLSLPGKKRIISNLISRESVKRSLNWLRRKSSKPPFVWPSKD